MYKDYTKRKVTDLQELTGGKRTILTSAVRTKINHLLKQVYDNNVVNELKTALIVARYVTLAVIVV